MIRTETGFWVVPEINPEPWTAPEVSIGRRGGKLVPNVFKREQLRAYQEALSDYIERVYQPEPFATTLAIRFYFWRELDTPHSKKADATNLQKSTEDALHELLFINDRQVQDVRSIIVQQDVGVAPTILIRWGPFEGLNEANPLEIRQAALEALSVRPAMNNETNIDPESFF